jgi:hypothetical protein
MLDVLNFIFSSPWTFIGTLMLISAFGDSAIGIIKAVKGSRLSKQ